MRPEHISDDAIAQRFEAAQCYRPGVMGGSDAIGFLAEIVMRIALETVCKPYGNRIKLDPIQNYDTTGTYCFVRPESGAHPGNLLIREAVGDKYRDIAELDQLLVADGLPTILELKFVGLTQQRKLSQAISAGTIQSRAEPVMRHLGCEQIAYGLIVPKGDYFAARELWSRDVMVIPFYAPTNIFQLSMRILSGQRNLPIKWQ